jgi:hypothetical protein
MPARLVWVFIAVLLMVAASLLHQWWRDWFRRD